MNDYNKSDDTSVSQAPDSSGNLVFTMTKGTATADIFRLVPDGRLALNVLPPAVATALGLQTDAAGKIVLA